MTKQEFIKNSTHEMDPIKPLVKIVVNDIPAECTLYDLDDEELFHDGLNTFRWNYVWQRLYDSWRANRTMLGIA